MNNVVDLLQKHKADSAALYAFLGARDIRKAWAARGGGYAASAKILYLLPRWHGSEEAALKFARSLKVAAEEKKLMHSLASLVKQLRSSLEIRLPPFDKSSSVVIEGVREAARLRLWRGSSEQQ